MTPTFVKLSAVGIACLLAGRSAAARDYPAPGPQPSDPVSIAVREIERLHGDARIERENGAFVTVVDWRSGDEGLALLKILPSVVAVRLGNSKITDDGLRVVGELADLRHLDLSYTDVTDQGLPYLGN